MSVHATSSRWILLLTLLLSSGGCGAGGEGGADGGGDVSPDGRLDAAEGAAADAGAPWPAVVAPRLETRHGYAVVWLAGTPYEMGVQQGELLHDVIAEAVEIVNADPLYSLLPELARNAGILQLAEAHSFPEILEECQGLVAATADVGFEMDFCLALNFGDVMLEFVRHGMPDLDDLGPGCSQVVATGEATADGQLYHARNLDWGGMDLSIIYDNPVLFVRQPTDGVPHVYVGFPMNLSPYTGMNLAGLSIGSNEIHPIGPEAQRLAGRSHVQMVARLLATATSLDEALSFVAAEGHMSNEALMVADGPAGRGAALELSGAAQAVRELDQGVVTLTNHFQAPETDPFDLPRDPETDDNSLLRAERLVQLVSPEGAETIWGNLDLERLAGVMRDRVHPRTGAESPPDTIDDELSLATNGLMHQVLFDPARGLFWVAAGQPPIHQIEYTCFSLDELLEVTEPRTCPEGLETL
jgi:hypothetical protein